MKKATTFNLILWTFLVLITLAISEGSTYLLDLNQLIYNNLSEQLTLKQIDLYFENKSRWSWLQYVLLPLILFLKTTIMAWVLAIGGFFKDIELLHRTYWRIVLQAEFVFLAAAVFKIGWFTLIQTDFTFKTIQNFVPLSIYSIVEVSEIPKWLWYPMQVINVFEMLYWLVLIALINRVAKGKKGFSVVAMSYGPALFMWIVFIMFLTLNFG